MSGIIGSAGSKSGVIGTTEIEYEEGEWIPVFKENNSATVTFTITDASYIKIGRMVFCSMRCTRNDSGSFSGSVTWSAPFVSENISGHSSWCPCGTAWPGSAEVAIVLQDNYASDIFNAAKSNTSGVSEYINYTNLANTDIMAAAFQYQTVS